MKLLLLPYKFWKNRLLYLKFYLKAKKVEGGKGWILFKKYVRLEL
jgi:hypothetical protein